MIVINKNRTVCELFVGVAFSISAGSYCHFLFVLLVPAHVPRSVIGQ